MTPTLAEFCVVESGQATGFDVGEQVVEVDGILRNDLSSLLVDGRQVIDFFPEGLLIHIEHLKKGGLHVAGDERLVEIPDAGDDVLAVNGSWNHGGSGFERMDGWRQSLLVVDWEFTIMRNKVVRMEWSCSRFS